MRLAGKVAIVTGGGSGFGEAIAKRFAEEGAKLVVNDVNDEGGTRVAKEIDGAQGQGSATYLRADVARDGDMGKLIAGALDRYGHIEIMVNNAGITHVNRPMLEVGEEEFDRIYAVNV
ncbi:MAG TPA: SDR family NAD(P)-dependent oxidoreductase, partial [Stellaceae bacterium]|nr:SDR family NAD(P)-dependent oxidoreductase [Stellaceae bacterium]